MINFKSLNDLCPSGMTSVNEDWLWDVVNEMEIGDGAIWVYGIGEDGFGCINLTSICRCLAQYLHRARLEVEAAPENNRTFACTQDS
jgi:hypothetical protein